MTNSNDDDLLSRIVSDLAAREKVYRDARENIERAQVSLNALGPLPAMAGSMIKESGISPRVTRRAGPKQISTKWFKITKVCPNCGKEKNVGREFGVVVRRGEEEPYSWCTDCRGIAAKKTYEKRKQARLAAGNS